MFNNPFSLEGRNIIVTGASSGIGRQCAINCSFMGARVILIGRDTERLKETLNGMNMQMNHLVFSLDLTNYEKVKDVVDQIVAQIGKISGLINCAGISQHYHLIRVVRKKWTSSSIPMYILQ